MALGHWLVKSEPSTYGWAHLVKEKRTLWTGVRNFTARNNLAAMKKGDLVLFYHSGEGKEVVGVAQVTAEAQPDTTAKAGEGWVAVELAPVKALATPVTLAAVKAEAVAPRHRAREAVAALGDADPEAGVREDPRDGEGMTLKLLFAALAIAAGVATALQAATNAGLSKSAGLGPALVVNTVVVLIGAIGLWAALGAKPTFFPESVSWTFYLGGLYGFVIIASLAFVFPKIGAAYAIALMVAGQCVAALLVDHFGLVGMPRDPVTIQRVIGVALVAAGAVVMRA